MMRILVLRVTDVVGRLDRYIASDCADLSRSMAQRLIKERRVFVNGVPAKASYSPVPGDVIRVELPALAPSYPDAEEIPLRILFEDEQLLIVDKPVGLVVHPGSGHASGTLVNALLAHRPNLVRADLDPQRPGIVHRLDRDTSGLLVVAATREAQLALQAQFKSREVQKAYALLVYGHLAPERGAIEGPIGRDPANRKRMKVVSDGGRYARTEYHVIEHLPGCTLVEARLLTGRTHQLRVHFSSIGYSVVGDRVYGHRRQRIDAPRQLLHARYLAFRHPVSGETVEFTSELPSDFVRVLEALRGPV